MNATELGITDAELSRSKTVRISMVVDSYVLLFGVPLMIFAVIMGTLLVSHWVIPQPAIHVAAPVVQASLNTPAPVVNATIEVPRSNVPVTVNVPAQGAPIVNFSAPQGEAPKVTVNVPDGKPGEIRTVDRVIERVVDRPVYVWVDTREKASVTFEDVIQAAQKYLQRVAKDFDGEQKKWLDAWQGRVRERQGDEQGLFNTVLIEKRGGFDTSKATPAEVCEVCRLILRVRDAGLSVPEVFKSQLTPASLVLFRNFLEK
jgi:hypothetical protein